jgi:hypothetical protein
MILLLRHAFTGEGLSSDAEAVAIWLAMPQNSTMVKLDTATNADLDKDSQQRLRKELLKAVPHLTRSARQLWRKRCQKASMINGTGRGSPSLMTVSAFSPDMYVSIMTDFFEAKSAGTGDTPASPKVTDQDIHLFSPSKSDHSRAASGSTQEDRPIVPATPSTQSTVWNTSQLDTQDQTVNTVSDHHRSNQQEEIKFTPSSPSGQGKQGAMWMGSPWAEETDSQRSVSSASLSMAIRQGHSMQTDIRALQSQHRAQRSMSVGSHLVIRSSEFPMEEPPQGISQKKCQPRTNPFRNGRPSKETPNI